MSIENLVGHTLEKVDQQGDDVILFHVVGGGVLRLYHAQVCCESVTIEDVSGDFVDLIGSPVLVAEERVSEEPPPGSERYDSDTWTFYTIRTLKGTVDIRWHGVSNGYYSESVNQHWDKPLTAKPAPSPMTNQPIREALNAEAWLTDAVPSEMVLTVEDALSILSTALAERDARIAELVGVLRGSADNVERIAFSIPPVNPYTPELATLASEMRSIAHEARAKLESSNG